MVDMAEMMVAMVKVWLRNVDMVQMMVLTSRWPVICESRWVWTIFGVHSIQIFIAVAPCDRKHQGNTEPAPHLLREEVQSMPLE